MIIQADTDRFFRELIEENEYRFLFENLSVIDLGCNIGSFSLWIYRLANVIHAIDISEENINNLNETIKENKLTKIHTHLLGIAGATGSRQINRDGEPGMGGWNLGKGPGEMPTLSLSEFMKREKVNHVDVLKIDIEGAELEVIDPLTFPKNNVSMIVGEVHVNNVAPMFKNLEDMGYRITRHNGGLFLAKK